MLPSYCPTTTLWSVAAHLPLRLETGRNSHPLTSYHDHPLSFVHPPLLTSPSRSPPSVYNFLSFFFACRALLQAWLRPPRVHLASPGLKSLPPPSSLSQPPHIFSPAPSQPHSSWFQLLASLSPSPVPFIVPVASAHVENPTKPHAATMQTHSATAAQPAEFLLSNLIDNEALISDISTSISPIAMVNPSDPWTRAHARVCAHANDKCPACSISIVCCSCHSLHCTPGPPPSSPAPAATVINRSHSASPSLFRDLGNSSTPPGFHDGPDGHDDDTYACACAECDTCDNSSCPHGHDEPASWTITVEQFDEDLEETYNRTFHACSACNHSCKKSFLGHCIKSRAFDNSLKEALMVADPSKASRTPALPKAIPPKTASMPKTSPAMAEPIPAPSTSYAPTATANPDASHPTTPLEVFATVSCTHRISCNHPHTTCSTCSRGIVCCACNNVHTAPARLQLRCIVCLHFACVTCTTPFCCSCRKPWFPGDLPTIVLASRFHGGARSTKSSRKGSSSSSQSSGPGSLATAHSEHPSPDPFDAGSSALPVVPTQASADEIDAFADTTVRVASTAANATCSSRAPSPSSNLPHTSVGIAESAPAAAVFSWPVIIGMTEDAPTAVPSHAPSRAASVASAASVGDAGIAEMLQPVWFPAPSDPPPLNDVVGRIHRRFPLASCNGCMYVSCLSFNLCIPFAYKELPTAPGEDFLSCT